MAQLSDNVLQHCQSLLPCRPGVVQFTEAGLPQALLQILNPFPADKVNSLAMTCSKDASSMSGVTKVALPLGCSRSVGSRSAKDASLEAGIALA